MLENPIKKWYVLHTYSGYENRVKESLEKKVKVLGIKDKIPRVLVPEEETIEVRGKRKKKIQKKLFPGYVILEIEVEKIETASGADEYKIASNIWEIIRNTQGVSGFVFSGSYPAPLSELEVQRILRRANTDETEEVISKPIIDIKIKVNNKVKIIGGPFAGSLGIVNEVNYETLKLKVMIDIFNRMTPVEVDIREIELL